MKQEKRLVAHENLIYDVICRQAGTLSKAILEGVMNSIDAGATRIDVEIKSTEITISDNGEGFKSEKEIDEWFGTFGTPHEVDEDDNSVDARYGRFRMGRGQLFAFGVNHWITNEFTMVVDVKHQGLKFTTEQHATVQHKGCRVFVDLYALQTPSELQATVRDISKFCMYVDVPLYVNSVQVNTPPATLSWDYETEDGWMKTIVSQENSTNAWRSNKGVDIYQQGVFVETVPEYELGVGGTVVSKGPLKLNFARNQVMRGSCPRWKRMYKLMRDVGQNNVKRKQTLSVNERLAVIDQIRSGDMRYFDVKTLKLFEDVQQKTWSASQIHQACNRNSIFDLLPDETLAVSFAPPLHPIGDRVLQARRALVLSRSVLEQWQVPEDEFVKKVLRRIIPSIKISYVPLSELDASQECEYHLLRDKDLTKKDKRILATLQDAGHIISRKFSNLNESRSPRIIRAGKSSHAYAWTDGHSFIAFDITHLRSALNTPTLDGWMVIARVLLHEYCHSEPDTQGHMHDAHFYYTFHEMSEHLVSIARYLENKYLTKLRTNSRKVPAAILKRAAKELEMAQYEKALELQDVQEVITTPCTL
jgi:hypothetical protein